MRTITVHYDERTGELLTETPQDAAFLNEKIRGHISDDQRVSRLAYLTDYFHPVRTR